ncbi:ORF6C domain protein [compost metagenome]
MAIDFEEYVEMNNKMLINMTEMIKKGKEEVEAKAINKVSEFIDKIENRMTINEKNCELVSNRCDELEDKNIELTVRCEKYEDILFVLNADRDKQKELTKLIQKLAFKSFTINKDHLKYKLFHPALISYCYTKLRDYFGVSSYKDIRINDFVKALTVVEDFYKNKQNIRICINKRLNTYIKDLNRGYLKKHQEKMVNDYLEQIGGDLKNAI